MFNLGGRGRGESETLRNPEGTQKWHQQHRQLAKAKGECEEIDGKLVVLNPQIIPTLEN